MATMYGDVGTGIADVIQARKAQREQGFYNSLLSYGMQAGGEFEIVNDKPVFTPGGDMPTKSAMWNQLLQAKGGRLSAADVQQFESSWKQANQMKTSKQLQELHKLSLKGYTPKDIKKVVKDSPELYNNLLDLISDLEASGDPAAMEQSLAMQQYLPGREERGVIGDIMAGEGGILGDAIVPAAIFGGPTAYKIATGRGKEAVGKAAESFRKERRAVTSDIKDEQKRLKTKTQEIKDKAKAIKDKQAKLKHPQKSPLLKNMKTDKRALTKEKRVLQSNIDELTKKRSDIKIKDPGSRISRLTKGRGFRPGFGTAAATSYFSGDVGEFLGGESAREPASVLANLGLLGYGIYGKNPTAAWTGAAGLGAQGLNYFFGDE